MIGDQLSDDEIAMMFGVDQPLEKFENMTLSQVQHQYLNEQAQELYRQVPEQSQPENLDDFGFTYDNGYRLGEELQQLRKALDVTQVELSEASQVDRSHLSQIENGYSKGYSSRAGARVIYKILAGLEQATQKKLEGGLTSTSLYAIL